MEKKRSKAGMSAWQEYKRRVKLWALGYLAYAIILPVIAVLIAIDAIDLLWALVFVPALLATYIFVDAKVDILNARWGDGARGEFRVGEELEKLHKEGFHIFHDWDSGYGNIDHFAVGPQGVFAIETKAWTGEITCRYGKIYRNGKPVTGNAPIAQAGKNAKKVRRLIVDFCRMEARVQPILCFSRVELRCYKPVRDVEVTNISSLNRILMNHERVYSSEEVRAISYLLEKNLETAPAATPRLPPAEPSRLDKAMNRLVQVHLSTVFLICFGFIFLCTFLFPGYFAGMFRAFAELYRVLDLVYASILS